SSFIISPRPSTSTLFPYTTLFRSPPDGEIRSGVAELSKRIAGNPAALGFYLRDEPNAQMMPGLGKLASLLREAMPDQWPYVNLRSEEHTSELQSPDHLVCRLLLEK